MFCSLIVEVIFEVIFHLQFAADLLGSRGFFEGAHGVELIYRTSPYVCSSFPHLDIRQFLDYIATSFVILRRISYALNDFPMLYRSKLPLDRWTTHRGLFSDRAHAFCPISEWARTDL